MGTMTEEQLDLFIQDPPRKPTGDGDCPGYDKCPISMCGCRWLYHGIPWIEGQDKAGQCHGFSRTADISARQCRNGMSECAGLSRSSTSHRRRVLWLTPIMSAAAAWVSPDLSIRARRLAGV